MSVSVNTQTIPVINPSKGVNTLPRIDQGVQTDYLINPRSDEDLRFDKLFDIKHLFKDLLGIFNLMIDELARNDESGALDGYFGVSETLEDDIISISTSLNHFFPQQEDGPDNKSDIEYYRTFPITSISWNSTGVLVAASYGLKDNSSFCQNRAGVVIWNTFQCTGRKDMGLHDSVDKETLFSRPEIVLDVPCCVTCVKFHPVFSNRLALGTCQGEVYIYDLHMSGTSTSSESTMTIPPPSLEDRQTLESLRNMHNQSDGPLKTLSLAFRRHYLPEITRTMCGCTDILHSSPISNLEWTNINVSPLNMTNLGTSIIQELEKSFVLMCSSVDGCVSSYTAENDWSYPSRYSRLSRLDSGKMQRTKPKSKVRRGSTYNSSSDSESHEFFSDLNAVGGPDADDGDSTNAISLQKLKKMALSAPIFTRNDPTAPPSRSILPLAAVAFGRGYPLRSGDSLSALSEVRSALFGNVNLVPCHVPGPLFVGAPLGGQDPIIMGSLASTLPPPTQAAAAYCTPGPSVPAVSPSLFAPSGGINEGAEPLARLSASLDALVLASSAASGDAHAGVGLLAPRSPILGGTNGLKWDLVAASSLLRLPLASRARACAAVEALARANGLQLVSGVFLFAGSLGRELEVYLRSSPVLRTFQSQLVSTNVASAASLPTVSPSYPLYQCITLSPFCEGLLASGTSDGRILLHSFSAPEPLLSLAVPASLNQGKFFHTSASDDTVTGRYVEGARVAALEFSCHRPLVLMAAVDGVGLIAFDLFKTTAAPVLVVASDFSSFFSDGRKNGFSMNRSVLSNAHTIVGSRSSSTSAAVGGSNSGVKDAFGAPIQIDANTQSVLTSEKKHAVFRTMGNGNISSFSFNPVRNRLIAVGDQSGVLTICSLPSNLCNIDVKNTAAVTTHGSTMAINGTGVVEIPTEVRVLDLFVNHFSPQSVAESNAMVLSNSAVTASVSGASTMSHMAGSGAAIGRLIQERRRVEREASTKKESVKVSGRVNSIQALKLAWTDKS